MSLNPAKCRVEIFCEPGFFDDSFAKGWTKTSGGTSSFSTDGDIAYLDKGDQANCIIEKSFSALSTNTYTKMPVRITYLNGTIVSYVWDGSAWFGLGTISSAGLYNITLPANKTITEIRFVADKS